jgi:hypothetical protein
MSRARAYCFTSFLSTEPYFDDTQTEYLVYGKEKCPKTGRDHWQGYVKFKLQKTLSAAQKCLIIGKSHMELCRGTVESNFDYYSKDGNYKEFGVRPKGQGNHADLKNIIEECEDIYDIQDKYPETYCRYRQDLIDIMKRKVSKNVKDYNPDKKVIYITGPSGCGKTRKAREECPKPYDIIDFANGFLIGYNGSRNVIYDEFRDSTIPLHDFLKLTDKYVNIFNIKGGSVLFDVDNLYITSIKYPDDLYKSDDESREQINRRINIINLSSLDDDF